MIHDPHAECLAPDELSALQARLFRTIARRFIDMIPLYRERLIEVFGTTGPETLSGRELLDDLARVRPVTRDEYLAIDDTLLAFLDRRLFFIDSSSGSTGSPKSRFCAVEDDLHDTELCSRAFASFGIGPGERVLTFDLADLTYYTQFAKAMQDCGVKNSMFFSARTDFAASMYEALILEPTTIITMPSILKRSLDGFIKRSREKKTVTKFVYFGEPLEPDLRVYLYKEFGIESFSLYGSTDIGWLAAECSAHDGMHLFADSVILHLLDDDNQTSMAVTPGEEGKALFTSLFQTGKPCLRYANGDRLQLLPGRCSCGRTTPRIKVTRRDTDLFDLLGTKISILEIQRLIYGSDVLSCFFQVELRDDNGKICFIVRLPEHLRDSSERIVEGLENRIGLSFYTCIDVVQIECEFVENNYFTTKKIPHLVDRRGERQ